MSETWRTSGLLRSTSGARAAIATALGLVSLGLAAGEAAAQTKREVNFGLPVAAINSSYCMFPTAMRLGFFAAEGLEVKIQNIAGSTSVVQTVLSGRLDVGGATPEPIFKSYSQGERLVMIYNFVRRPTGSVAVLDDSPIKALTDLRGKKLGAQSLASGNIMLTNAILSKLGIDPKTEISYLSVGVGAQALQSLRVGHVDGLILFDSLYAQMEIMGAKLRYFYGAGQENLFSTQFFMRRSVVEKEPDFVRGFGRAIAKATFFAQANPEACVRMLWQQFPASRIAGMAEQEQLRNDIAVLNKRMELLLPPEAPGQGWGFYDPKSVDAWNEFAFQGGIIERKVDKLDGIYTNQFVADFNKFNKNEIVARAKAWRN